jgi:tripartite-type tricarboxylate transporter receptor subunit TctC
MRALADEIGSEIGATVVVENWVGAAGSIGARARGHAPPDGYTICILNGESMLINPLIFKNMSLDPKTDWPTSLAVSSFGVHVPAGTPKAIVDKLNKAIVEVASKPEFQKRHMISRRLTPVLDSPEHFTKALESETALGRDVVKASGLYPNVE